MSEVLQPKRNPILADELKPEWIEQVREVIKRDQYKVRAGKHSTIEILSQGETPEWCWLLLPGQTHHFVDDANRDKVLQLITA